MRKVYFSLIGFTGRLTYPLRGIRLPVVLGKGWKALRMEITFIEVDTPNSYNVI